MQTQKVPRIGVILDGTDHFFRPVEKELTLTYRVDRFKPSFIHAPIIGERVNQYRLSRQLRGFLDKHEAVFFEWAGPLAALGSRLSSHTRRYVRVHRTELFTNINSLDWSSFERIIFVSHSMRKYFLEHFPEECGRTTVIHNGVDLERFRPNSKPFQWRIGMLGNLTPRKRVYDIICTLAEYSSDLPWRLIVGGDPLPSNIDYWKALQDLVKTLRIEDRVEFQGLVSDPAEWWSTIDVCVSASYSEGQQVALLEAMASGCFCLSHAWSGVEEILPPEYIFTTGFEFKSKLLSYAESTKQEKRLTLESLRKIAEEHFDQRRMLREILDLIVNDKKAQ